MDEVRSHHFETMGNHLFVGISLKPSSQGFLGGAGFRPSTECVGVSNRDVALVPLVPRK